MVILSGSRTDDDDYTVNRSVVLCGFPAKQRSLLGLSFVKAEIKCR
jgi:hypothetical protein